MPFYEVECKKCGHEYDVLSSIASREEKIKQAKCEECGSKSKKRLMPRSFAFNFANPVGTDRWNNEATGHDYRYKHNMPNVRKQREVAKQKSHMGTDPYPKIDDISSGKYFGEVQ